MQFTDRDFFLETLPEHVEYSWLLQLVNAWIENESLSFTMGVLATVDKQGHPISRTVAIREINKDGLIFFTQSDSSKVSHISTNPCVSFTFMLAKTQRQITVLGRAESLSERENSIQWETYDHERRLRFLVYGTKSGQIIKNQQQLDDELVFLRNQYKNKYLEKPKEYIGYMIVPSEIKFYQLNEHRLSDSITAIRSQNDWLLKRFVP